MARLCEYEAMTEERCCFFLQTCAFAEQLLIAEVGKVRKYLSPMPLNTTQRFSVKSGQVTNLLSNNQLTVHSPLIRLCLKSNFTKVLEPRRDEALATSLSRLIQRPPGCPTRPNVHLCFDTAVRQYGSVKCNVVPPANDEIATPDTKNGLQERISQHRSILDVVVSVGSSR